MNDADPISSPAPPTQAVGNLTCALKDREDGNLALVAMWAAYQRATAQSIESASKPLTTPQISLYASCYGILVSLTKSGEGVVSNGSPVQTLDYYPYGSPRINSQVASANTSRQYIGQFTDTNSLNYLNARYYEGSRGQFLSEDPTFLAIGDNNKMRQLTQRDQNTFLADPQQLNSYSYARGNPITNKDPSGLFVPEAVVGAGIGGIVGFGFQGVSDLVSWRLSSPQVYAGAITGGATFGGIVGATDGVSLLPLLFAGGASGAVQSGTTQGLNIANGSQGSFSYGDLLTNTGIGAGTALIPGVRMAGVTAGRGSYQAVERQMYTKLGTGTLAPQNIGLQTYGKMTVSYATQQAPGAAVQGTLSNLSRILSAISGLISAFSTSNNSKQK